MEEKSVKRERESITLTAGVRVCFFNKKKAYQEVFGSTYNAVS